MKLQRKIILLKRSGKKRPKVTITFSDESVFEFSEDVFISTRFEVGDDIHDDEFESLLANQQIHECKFAALSLINYRFRSTAELITRLIQKGFEKNIIDQTIKFLSEKKFLNDTSFAETFIHDRIHSRSLGPIAIKRELFKHKIDSEIADRIIEKVYNDLPEEELVESLMEKKKIEPELELSQKDKDKLIRFLQRRGHRWGVIRVVFEKWNI